MEHGILFILGGILLWQGVMLELAQRRAERRETELLKLIRNLQNRIQARSFAEYSAMEDREPKPPAPAEAVTQELVNEVLSNRFQPADGMNL